MSLDGSVALVTGGARGIGRSIAERLAADGADVVIGDSAGAAASSEVVAAIGRIGRRAFTVQADIGRPADVRALFATAAEGYGKIDIVIANAGVELVDIPFADYADDQIERVLDVNVKGTFLTLREAARTIVDGASA